MFRPLWAMVAMALLTGCSDDGTPAAGPGPVAASSAPTVAATADDVAGMRACDLLKRAIDQASLMDPGVVDSIRAASTSADAPLSDAAGRLATAYATAVAAQGREAEPDAVAAVGAAGAEMIDTCTDSGLETVG